MRVCFTNAWRKSILFVMASQLSLEFLRNLPKVELHRHLECSMRLSTLVELATDLGMSVPETKEEITRELLVTTPMRDLESVLKKFLRTQQVLHSEEILARITFEAIEDAVAEGIRILELRWAPTYVAQGHANLTFDKIIRGVRRGVEMAKDLPIAVGMISIIQRTLPLSEAERVLDFTLENKDFFIAMDLADNEAGFQPQAFEKVFRRARAEGLGVTIHAGEACIPEASLNVKKAIDFLGATRIGHGVQIAQDPGVMNLVRQQSIPLELCVTSNWLTQAVPSITAHPIRILMEAGIPITINTDDPGVFGINLVHEYEILTKFYQFTEAEFNQCNDVAAQASFIPLIKRQKFWPRPIHTLR